MSGDGVLTVRLPLSLLGALQAEAQRQGITIHEAARRVISFLPTVSQDDFVALPEATRELRAPKVSLYVGWRVVDVLTAATQKNGLTNSSIVRKLLNGLLISHEIKFVQQDEHWKLKIMLKKNTAKNHSDTGQKEQSCA